MITTDMAKRNLCLAYVRSNARLIVFTYKDVGRLHGKHEKQLGKLVCQIALHESEVEIHFVENNFGN